MKLLRVTNESRSSPKSSIECELATRFIAPHRSTARVCAPASEFV
jgi:hypothetical protein